VRRPGSREPGRLTLLKTWGLADVHRGLFGRRRTAVDAHVLGDLVLLQVGAVALVLGQQPAGALVADLVVVEELVGLVARLVVVIVRARARLVQVGVGRGVRLLLAQPLVELAVEAEVPPAGDAQGGSPRPPQHTHQAQQPRRRLPACRPSH
jgi:hypothetical protein